MAMDVLAPGSVPSNGIFRRHKPRSVVLAATKPTSFEWRLLRIQLLQLGALGAEVLQLWVHG